MDIRIKTWNERAEALGKLKYYERRCAVLMRENAALEAELHAMKQKWDQP